MPLVRGYTRRAFSKNVSRLRFENRFRKRKRSRAQMLAIAYRTARTAARHAGKRPSWLYGKKRHRLSKVRYRRKSR